MMQGNPVVNTAWRSTGRSLSWKVFKVVILFLGLLSLAGCVRGCKSSRPPIHLVPDMDRQPRYLPQSQSGFFYDGATMRAPVEGTIARGELREDKEFYTGATATGFVTNIPLEVDRQLLDQGEKKYDIFCLPCHGDRGDGLGMLRVRAGIQAANLLEERSRQMPDGQMFDVITHGFGLMPAYRYPIQPQDRWAVVAYVRQLQQAHAPVQQEVQTQTPEQPAQ